MTDQPRASIEDQLRRYADAIDPAMADVISVDDVHTNESEADRPARRNAAVLAFAALLIAIVGVAFAVRSNEQVELDVAASVGQEPSTTAEGTHELADAEYRVQAGDTIESIAARFGTTAEAILEANDGLSPNQLIVGQALRVRGVAAGEDPDPANFVIHTVVEGDLLSTIAERYGVTMSSILQANPELDPDTLMAGDELVISLVSDVPFVTTPTPVPPVPPPTRPPPPFVDPAALCDPVSECGRYWLTRTEMLIVHVARLEVRLMCMDVADMEADRPDASEFVGPLGGVRRHPFFGIATKAAAQLIGYESVDGTSIDGLGYSNDAKSLPIAALDTYNQTWGACRDLAENRLALSSVVEQFSAVAQQAGDLHTTDARLRAALEEWRVCLSRAVDIPTDGHTPATFADRWVEVESVGLSQRQRDVALADARCQRSAQLESGYYLALYDSLDRDDRAEVLAIANDNYDTLLEAIAILDERGVTPPALD